MKKPTDTALAISPDYREFIEDLKARVVAARISAARAVTHPAILLTGTLVAASWKNSRP